MSYKEYLYGQTAYVISLTIAQAQGAVSFTPEEIAILSGAITALGGVLWTVIKWSDARAALVRKEIQDLNEVIIASLRNEIETLKRANKQLTETNRVLRNQLHEPGDSVSQRPRQ